MWWLQPQQLYSGQENDKEVGPEIIRSTVSCLPPDFLLGKKYEIPFVWASTDEFSISYNQMHSDTMHPLLIIS